MRVFILCSGRTGSTSFIKACQFITNYTSSHESLAKQIELRFNYPDNHIEADNRLSWFLGKLDKLYGDDAYYVVLKREKAATLKSFGNRWQNQGSIIKAFTEGILMQKLRKLSSENKYEAISLYYDTVYDNIDQFVKDKTHVLNVSLENIEEDFKAFCDWIGAEGDLIQALLTFQKKHNSSQPKSIFQKILKKITQSSKLIFLN